MLLLAAWLNFISTTATSHSCTMLFNTSFTKILTGRNIKISGFRSYQTFQWTIFLREKSFGKNQICFKMFCSAEKKKHNQTPP